MTEAQGTPAAPAAEGTPSLGTPAAPPAGGAEETFPRSYVEQLRQENAQHRINARDAAEQVRTAVLGEVKPQLEAKDGEITRLTDELGSAWVLAEKINQSIAAGVPADKLLAFAGAVQGVDAASIKASAESLKALFGLTGEGAPPVGATDPTQGQGQRGLANPAQDPMLRDIIALVGKK